MRKLLIVMTITESPVMASYGRECDADRWEFCDEEPWKCWDGELW